jgi:hypothetical protein
VITPDSIQQLGCDENMQLEGASMHSNHPDQVLDALEMSLGDPAGQHSQNLSQGAVHSTVICNRLYGIQHMESREPEVSSSTRLHEAYQPQPKCIQFRFCTGFFTFSIWLLHFPLGLELLMDFKQRRELLLTVPLASTSPSACCARSAW